MITIAITPVNDERRHKWSQDTSLIEWHIVGHAASAAAVRAKADEHAMYPAPSFRNGSAEPWRTRPHCGWRRSRHCRGRWVRPWPHRRAAATTPNMRQHSTVQCSVSGERRVAGNSAGDGGGWQRAAGSGFTPQGARDRSARWPFHHPARSRRCTEPSSYEEREAPALYDHAWHSAAPRHQAPCAKPRHQC